MVKVRTSTARPDNTEGWVEHVTGMSLLVQQDGHLHVNVAGDRGTVAVYAPGAWVSAEVH